MALPPISFLPSCHFLPLPPSSPPSCLLLPLLLFLHHPSLISLSPLSPFLLSFPQKLLPHCLELSFETFVQKPEEETSQNYFSGQNIRMCITHTTEGWCKHLPFLKIFFFFFKQILSRSMMMVIEGNNYDVEDDDDQPTR